MAIEHFLPSKHGLRFKNITIRNDGGRFLLGGIPFGMCGGMCVLVLAHLQKPMSTQALFRKDTPPVLGSTDFFRLFYYQLKSLFPILLFKLVGFQLLSSLGQERTHRYITKQWAAIIKALHRGSVVRVCLVKRPGVFSKPWENHQILVYGQIKTNTAIPYLRIYDPNHPLDDNVVIAINSKGAKPMIAESTGERWFGLFIVA